jgi:PPOX class probable F420-dependent enzyme
LVEQPARLLGATTAQIEFLLAARVACLATAGAAARPHVLPVCFALVDGDIYSPLDLKPKRVAPDRLQRVKDITLNPAVCLVIDRYSEDWSQLAWLQIRADAGLVEPDDPTHGPALKALRDRYSQYSGMALELRPLLRLRPRRVVSWGV